MSCDAHEITFVAFYLLIVSLIFHFYSILKCMWAGIFFISVLPSTKLGMEELLYICIYIQRMILIPALITLFFYTMQKG